MATLTLDPITVRKSISNSNILTITAFYNPPPVIDTEIIFIADDAAFYEDTEYKENELVAQMRNNPKDIDYFIDNNGSLLVQSDDSDNYSINNNGELIYTE